jgi:hypothetical protein
MSSPQRKTAGPGKGPTASRGIVETAQLNESVPESKTDYDAQDDLAGSIAECYAAIRARITAGGPGWTPPRCRCRCCGGEAA